MCKMQKNLKINMFFLYFPISYSAQSQPAWFHFKYPVELEFFTWLQPSVFHKNKPFVEHL